MIYRLSVPVFEPLTLFAGEFHLRRLEIRSGLQAIARSTDDMGAER
jgi:hypothetical protein